MHTLEDLFVREFKQSVHLLGSKDVFSVKLPEVCKGWQVSGSEQYRVFGINTEYYDRLNDTVVKRLPKGYVAKRRVVDKTTRSYKKDVDGSFVYQDYKVPSGSVIVVSSVSIGLPYSRYLKPVEGYDYIDFVREGGKISYLYAIPGTCLYKINQTALALSVKNMKNYDGAGFLTWEDGVIYLHVIPYNPNSSYIGSKILKTGMTLDYSSEIKMITDYWERINFIPNIKLCALQSGENLVIKPTIRGYQEYNVVEVNPIGVKDIIGADTE